VTSCVIKAKEDTMLLVLDKEHYQTALALDHSRLARKMSFIAHNYYLQQLGQERQLSLRYCLTEVTSVHNKHIYVCAAMDMWYVLRSVHTHVTL
jgi:hypothetical protein